VLGIVARLGLAQVDLGEATAQIDLDRLGRAAVVGLIGADQTQGTPATSVVPKVRISVAVWPPMVRVASIASRPLSILIGPGMPPPRQSSVAMDSLGSSNSAITPRKLVLAP
jgi:hypothetical protein